MEERRRKEQVQWSDFDKGDDDQEVNKRLQEDGFWPKSQLAGSFGVDLELLFDELWWWQKWMMMTVITFKELNSGPSLMVRGGFGGDPEPAEPVHFEDEYEDLNAYRERWPPCKIYLLNFNNIWGWQWMMQMLKNDSLYSHFQGLVDNNSSANITTSSDCPWPHHGGDDEDGQLDRVGSQVLL